MEKIIRKKAFQVKPIEYLKVGDPSYFRELAKGSANPNLRDFTCDIKMPVTKKKPVAFVQIQEVGDSFEYHGKTIETTKIVINLFQAKPNTYAFGVIKLHLYNQYIPAEVKKIYTLGCDSAQFDIWINDKCYNVQTGADGYYGSLFHYNRNEAYILELSMDSDLFDWDDANKFVNNLFEDVRTVNSITEELSGFM